MITNTMVLNRLKLELGDDVFNVFDPKYFLDIMESETLYTWSVYYPYIIRGVVVTRADVIESIHPQTGKKAYYKYKIPKENPEDEYISIEMEYYPANFHADIYNGITPMVTDNVIGKLNALMPIASKRYSVLFRAPDIAQIDPIPRTHIDFTLDMQRKVRLYEIPLYYREPLLALITADVKNALYNKFKNLRDGQTYQGLEVNSYIGDYQDAKSERKEILEMLQKDYFKNPERFRAIVQYS